METNEKTPKVITIQLSNRWAIQYIKELINSEGYSSYAEIVREALRLHSRVELKVRTTV